MKSGEETVSVMDVVVVGGEAQIDCFSHTDQGHSETDGHDSQHMV